jgi:hypothetical protein
MKKIILIFYFMLLMLYSFSQQQPCNDEVIMNTKGSWKKVSDANPFPDQSFPKNQYPQVISRIDKMQKLLQAAYPQPNGMEAGWYHSISGNAAVKTGPVPYALDALFLAYHCSYEKKLNRKVKPGEVKPAPGSMYGPINLIIGLLTTLNSILFKNNRCTC